MSDGIRIVRAAAVRGGTLAVWPRELVGTEEVRGADVLADAALRATTALLSGMSAEGMGMVIGTEFGCLEMDREFEQSRVEAGGRYASPAAFARTLPSTVMAEVALKCGIKGPGLVASGGQTSAALAVERAVRWMQHFSLAFCVAGGMEWRGEEVRVGLVLLGRGEGREATELRGVSLDRFIEWIDEATALAPRDGR